MLGADFTQELHRLEKAFKRNYHPDTANIMWRRLKFYPLEAMREAVDNLLCEERHFPTFKEIKGALDRIMSSSERHKMVEDPRRPKGAPRIRCLHCEDSGIKLRLYRSHIARDFYCVCPAGEAITKFEWRESDFVGRTAADIRRMLRTLFQGKSA